MMKNKTIRTALLSTAFMAVAGVAGAAGTAPNTNIVNSISLSYTSGGETIERDDVASVAFVVDRKIDFVLESQVAGRTAAVEQGSDEEFIIFLLKNEGNDASGYDIGVTSTPSGFTLAKDSDGTLAEGEYEILIGTAPGENSANDAVLGTSAANDILADVAADGMVYVKIRASIPGDAPDGTSNLFNVGATALEPNSSTVVTQSQTNALDTVDTIFADGAGGADTPDGYEEDNTKYLIMAPQLTGTKVARVISENRDGNFNCETGTAATGDLAAVPGACVEYTITVTNATGASVSAKDLEIEDKLPSSVTYAAHAEGDFTSVAVAGDIVTAQMSSLPEGQSASFTIRVTID